ncbi:Asp-tRNA(Asn)/Glu-tRNA(Gln) amidotransferase subunit GatA [Dermatobacter hominis]|uniref:Asp-tRNA(Asn)/Glu-tRNA(Gln) amidotransferase subunit GatA n=1 Tax=Dermatobacter hominis TaxID=2884263 RepID=UPI001D1227B8|nr:Asp-tRNA(Asn)/Glu-tRNA(Gln) amidotransferase subunit GatA [Dermatobacter hominis]UDY37117.1 Asp-tRNA(Asn)/Glu-tRNA(Gln) amidotransferase subunit GatA [Dermatobacter hominis]
MTAASGPLRSASDIAAGVRTGELSALEVLDDHLARIALRESEIHAFNHLTEEAARAAAADIDRRVAAGEDPGPLAGVPVAIKDNLCTSGVPTTCSSKILEGWLPPYDATVVTRLAAAGAVAVGKTNLDEFAMGSSTENSAFGPTRNPHDTTRVPGGSSGGSAAAVAAGFAPLALGSDTGGSIRQPASLCGVVGVKPTYGTVSRLGLVAFGSSLDQVGPFSTTVADAALALEVMGGHDPGDSTSLPQPFPSVSDHLDDGVDGLRVGIVTEMMGEGIAPDVAARVRAAADALAAAGAEVDEVSVPAVAFGLSAYYLVAPAEASSNLARYDGVRYGLRIEAATTGEMMELTRTAGFGDEVKRRIMLGTYALSAGYYEAFYGKALKVRTLIRRDFDAAYERFDVLLSPTSPTTAFPFGDKTADPLQMYLNDICTIPTNLAGHPAMSVPFGAGDDGLPVGVQVLAPALGEVAMFRTAAALEAAAVPVAATTEGSAS